jgi:chromosome partitioning protein
MILLIGGEKGGTGKTTIAVNLAAYFVKNKKNTLIVDTDKQQSATAWCKLRAQVKVPPVEVIQQTGNITHALVSLKRHYDIIIVDAGGRDSVELRSALMAADLFYSPVRASQYDLLSLERMHNVVKEARKINTKLKSYVFVNCASTHPKVSDTREALDHLSFFVEFFLSEIISERSAFKKTAFTGLGVHELPRKDKDEKAINELTKLGEAILNV